MTFTPHGKHLIAGEWLTGEGTFQSSPAHGMAHDFSTGTVDLVNRACEAAEDAFAAYAATSREDRARFLEAIADGIEARAEAITAKVTPGDSVMQALGGRTPTGVPVPDAVWRPILEGGKNGGRRGGRPGGRPANRGHGSFGGGRPRQSSGRPGGHRGRMDG